MNGVVNVPVTDPTLTNGFGFVVSYIPDSRYKPHRAEFGERAYFFRVGDDCGVLPHELLRQLFYPRPVMRMGARVQSHCTGFDVSLKVMIVNKGTSSAHDLFVVAKWELPWDPAPSPGGSTTYAWDHSVLDGQQQFESKRPLHPTAQSMMLAIRSRMSVGEYTLGVRLKITIYSRDSEPQHFEIAIPLEKLLRGCELDLPSTDTLD